MPLEREGGEGGRRDEHPIGGDCAAEEEDMYHERQPWGAYKHPHT